MINKIKIRKIGDVFVVIAAVLAIIYILTNNLKFLWFVALLLKVVCILIEYVISKKEKLKQQ